MLSHRCASSATHETESVVPAADTRRSIAPSTPTPDGTRSQSAMAPPRQRRTGQRALRATRIDCLACDGSSDSDGSESCWRARRSCSIRFRARGPRGRSGSISARNRKGGSSRCRSSASRSAAECTEALPVPRALHVGCTRSGRAARSSVKHTAERTIASVPWRPLMCTVAAAPGGRCLRMAHYVKGAGGHPRGDRR